MLVHVIRPFDTLHFSNGWRIKNLSDKKIKLGLSFPKEIRIVIPKKEVSQ